MYSYINLKKSLLTRCLDLIEDNFSIKFTRKTYQNKHLEVFFKLHWLKGTVMSTALVIKRDNYWHITHIVTQECYQGSGYAKKLLNKIIKQAKKSKISYVSCNVKEEDFKSQNLFRSCNFSYKTDLPKGAKVKEGFKFYSYEF